MPNRTITTLERERRARGWSQTFLAAMLGVDGSTVSLWEHGRRRPTGQRAAKLERVFSIRVDDLLSDDATAPHRAAA